MTKRKDPKDLKKSGRHTKWKKEYNVLIVEYFQKALDGAYREHQDVHGKMQVLAGRLPSLIEFARTIGVWHDDLANWAKEENVKKYPGFLSAYLCAKDLQKQFLMLNGSVGAGNPRFIQFLLACNHGMVEPTNFLNNGGSFEAPVIMANAPLWPEKRKK